MQGQPKPPSPEEEKIQAQMSVGTAKNANATGD